MLAPNCHVEFRSRQLSILSTEPASFNNSSSLIYSLQKHNARYKVVDTFFLCVAETNKQKNVELQDKSSVLRRKKVASKCMYNDKKSHFFFFHGRNRKNEKCNFLFLRIVRNNIHFSYFFTLVPVT